MPDKEVNRRHDKNSSDKRDESQSKRKRFFDKELEDIDRFIEEVGEQRKKGRRGGQ